MDDTLPQDETTLHTPNVLPYYDLSNCTFKEESIPTMGDDVIADRNDSDTEGSFKVDTCVEADMKRDDNDDDEVIIPDEDVTKPVDVKMEDIVTVEPSKPRPPALILTKSPTSLSSNFKKIVDETLSDEPSTSTQSTAQNIKTIVVKPLPKLTRILPMVPVTTTTNRIAKFATTPKILQINLNEPGKRLLLPKSRSLEEKQPISVKDKLKATILKTSTECETIQANVKRYVTTVINDKKSPKKDAVDSTDDKLKVSRNRAAAKRYR